MNMDAVAVASLLLVVAAVGVVAYIGYRVKGWIDQDTEAHKK